MPTVAGRPRTGASTYPTPRAAAWAAIATVVAGSIVLMSTMTVPATAAESSPPGPATHAGHVVGARQQHEDEARLAGHIREGWVQ